MTTLISVRSTGVANIATAPVPNTSVVQQATETVSVRSENAVVVQGAPTETVVGTEPATMVLQVATTSVSVISVNTGGSTGTGKVDIFNRKISSKRIVEEFEVMTSHEMFLETDGEIRLNGTDGDTCGVLFLL